LRFPLGVGAAQVDGILRLIYTNYKDQAAYDTGQQWGRNATAALTHPPADAF
jgi:hypothetical protein